MSDYRISPPSLITGRAIVIDLPPSKSIVNRELIVRAALGVQLSEMDDSAPNDILIMHENLLKRAQNPASTKPTVYDARDAGTVFRYLTALLAFSPGQHVLTGTTRMKERPVGPLVDVLCASGAQIHYSDRTGFPPLHIIGIEPEETGIFKFGLSSSSQFISACLLVAPLFKRGITVQYPEGHTSNSYIDLTLDVLRNWGCQIHTERNSGRISQSVKTVNTSEHSPETTEKDWSAAAYIMALAGLLPNCPLIVDGLHPTSVQGDRIALKLFNDAGVKATNDGHTFTFTSSYLSEDPGIIDFSGCPDLAPPYIVYCAIKGIPFHGTGLEHLRLKESDRIRALQINLQKIGLDLKGYSGNYRISGNLRFDGIPTFESFDDHRIAMSFAMCGVKFPVIITGAECVAKSFPHFWEQIERIGLIIEKEEQYNGVE